jgi:hypothetical protein
MIRPSAAIQLTSIEFVIGKPNTRPISTAFGDSSFSSSSAFFTVLLFTVAVDANGLSDCALIVSDVAGNH